MKIDRINCEAFFLDYYEKNLTPVEVAELLFFLEENPDLRELFERFGPVEIEKSNVHFPGKISLKQWGRGELERLMALPVSKENCDLYFIAMTEGLLDQEQKGRVEAFLIKHPERRKDLEIYSKCIAPVPEIAFAHKESLRKEVIAENNIDEQLIRKIEGDLSPAEELALGDLLAKNPQYQKELDLFNKTLLPKEKIVFEGKELLKKRERKPVIIALFSSRSFQYAAAAAILLLAGLFLFMGSEEKQPLILAEKSETARPTSSPVKNTESEKQVSIAEFNPDDATIKETFTNVNANVNEEPKALTVQTTTLKNTVPAAEAVTPDEIPALAKEEFVPQISTEIEEETLLAQAEPVEAEVMPELNIEETTIDEAVANTSANTETESPVVLASSDEGYQSVRAFASKKLKGLFGIKEQNACDDEEKFGWWEVAMAAKNGIQNIMGSRKMEIEKKCDGVGNTTEYVFMAGNFQFSTKAKNHNKVVTTSKQ